MSFTRHAILSRKTPTPKTYKYRTVKKNKNKYQFCPCGLENTRLSTIIEKNTHSWICRRNTFHWVGPCCNINNRCKFHPEEELFYTGELWAASVFNLGSRGFWKSPIEGYVPNSITYAQHVQYHKKKHTYENKLTALFEKHIEIHVLKNRLHIHTGLQCKFLLTCSTVMGIWEITLSETGAVLNILTHMFMPTIPQKHLYTLRLNYTKHIFLEYNWINSVTLPLMNTPINITAPQNSLPAFPPGCTLYMKLRCTCIRNNVSSDSSTTGMYTGE